MKFNVRCYYFIGQCAPLEQILGSKGERGAQGEKGEPGPPGRDGLPGDKGLEGLRVCFCFPAFLCCLCINIIK